MVSWIWIATAIMALGGLVALVPSMRRMAVTASPPVPTAPVAIEGSR
jgi:cytochrome c biogenesis factor